MGEAPFGSRISSRPLCSRVAASTLRRQGPGRLQWAHCTGLQVCSTCRQSPRQPGRIVLLLLALLGMHRHTRPAACSIRPLLTVQRLAHCCRRAALQRHALPASCNEVAATSGRRGALLPTGLPEMSAVAEAAHEAATRQLERFRAEMAAESARMKAALEKQVYARQWTMTCVILKCCQIQFCSPVWLELLLASSSAPLHCHSSQGRVSSELQARLGHAAWTDAHDLLLCTLRRCSLPCG